MKRIKMIALLALGGLVSACADSSIASRNAPFEATPLSAQTLPPQGAVAAQAPVVSPLVSNIDIVDITVRVPRALSVSEANRYLPQGDIVWREDPIGDRHAQVGRIFQTAMQRGTETLEGAVRANLEVEVTRFHALTEKARYTTGGVHNIGFILSLRDPETGVLLAEPRAIRADLDAFGGAQALAAEARGQTQKVRITAHLAEVIRQELTTAEGFQNPKLGFIQAMNQI